MRNKCICGNLLVSGKGPQQSKILLLGSYPDYEDQKSGVVLTGRSGEILNHELARVGLQLSAVRYTNVWGHMKNDCDPVYHRDHAALELKGRTHVLVMGSEASQFLFNRNSGDLSGLVMKHPIFTGTIFVVSPGIAEIYGTGLGEIRLALSRFSDTINKRR